MTDNKDRATEINKRIGSAIKQLRLIRGMTQTDMASRLGITFQQLQKYETGKNRVSADRLVLIAEILVLLQKCGCSGKLCFIQ